MNNEQGYSQSQAEYYKEYYDLSDDDKENIKQSFFNQIAKNYQNSETVNILLLGVGTGRLEILLLESLATIQQIRTLDITAVDSSKEMIDCFETALNKHPSINSKIIILRIIHKDIRSTNDFFDKNYDIITAFFVIHIVNQWNCILKNIISHLKKDGFFLVAEETGMVSIIDNLFPIEKIVSNFREIDKNYIALWRTFQNDRIKKGKIWYQPIVASYYLLIIDILQKLKFNKICDENIPLTPSRPYIMKDFENWIDNEYLFTPIGKFLTDEERKDIADKVYEKIKNYDIESDFEFKRIEGHRFIAFQKKDEPSELDIDDAITQSMKVFFNEIQNIALIDRNITLKGLDSMPEEAGLFKDIEIPDFKSKKYNIAIKNRIFILGVTLLHWFYNRVHFDYVMWKPDYYFPEKSTYQHDLPIFIYFDANTYSEDIYCHYVATYSLYFFARQKLVKNRTFIDFVFHTFRYFTLIVIERGKQFTIKIDFLFDKTTKLVITLPPFIISEQEQNELSNIISNVAESVKSDKKLSNKQYLLDFDYVSSFIENKNFNFANEIASVIKKLFDQFKEKYYSTFQEGFREEFDKLKYIFDIKDATDEDVSELLKGLFCFNIIGILKEETKWKKIRFYNGFIFGMEPYYEGFNILVNIDFHGDDRIDSIVNIPSKIWSSKDGLYGSLQLIKEYVYTHALRSAVSAIMSRNMSHNIGSHVIFYATYTGNAQYSKEDYRNFLRYLQGRMDFLSLASTSEANWGIKYSLKTLIDSLKKQKILCENIVKSEGIDNNLIKIKIIPYHNIAKLPNTNLPDILIPHGEAGKHTLYTIIENFIRNVAKHQWSILDNATKSKVLQIKIHCSEESTIPDMYKVTVSSNVPGCNNNLIKKLNEKLSESILDEERGLALKQTNRGFKEQRISACFLRLLPLNKIEEYTPNRKINKELPLIEAICIKNNHKIASNIDTCNTENCSFGIAFYVKKPLELLWIGEHNFSQDQLNELKYKGILIYSKIEEAEINDAKTFPGKMAIISYEVKKEIEELDKIRQLPYRIIVINNQDKKSKWVSINSHELPDHSNLSIDEYADTLLKLLWEKWVKATFNNASESSIQIGDSNYSNELTTPFTKQSTSFILTHGNNIQQPKDNNRFYLSYSSTDVLGKLISASMKKFYLRWEIAEMVYSRILILDERIYNLKDRKKNDKTIEEIWKKLGVDIKNHLDIINDPNNIGSILNNFDFIIIHQGIIDKIIDKHGPNSLNTFWNSIIEKVAFPVIVSGRGKPDLVREGKGRWLQLSDLQAHILDSAGKSEAKYNLLQVLFALREEKEEK
jgi:SAM-dependent methyltransferase